MKSSSGRPDGSRWWGLTAGTRLSENENVEYIVDVTNRKQAETALRASEAGFRTLTDAVPQVIWTNDTDGTASYFNQRWYEYSGLSKEESAGLGWQAIVHPDDASDSVARWRQALAAGEVFDTEYRLRRADGVYRWFIGRNVPLLDEQRMVRGWFGSATDIEEIKQAQEALREADHRKDEFLAMLAHELRNPLAPIRNVVQILQLTGEDNETVAPALALMSRQVDHLVRLVDDLLDVSRISRGKIELQLARLDLNALVSQAVESIRPLYENHHRQLSVQLPESPLYLQGDATRLTQVVTNLLTNGVRYTGEEGQVWVTLEQGDGPAPADRSHGGSTFDGPTLRQEAILRVRDNGIGLPADQLNAIFELFVQIDNSLARSQGGLGLGLTLVKRLVELHGGRVKAHSPGLGQGSEFIVYLPMLHPSNSSMNKSNEMPSSLVQGHRAADRRILVVDDNVDAATTLAMLLKMKKYEVHTCHSGRQALEAGERLHPAVVLLDIGMPDLDGYATCRLIREQDWGRNIVLIALTGYGQEEDKQRSREAGFNDHLVKPVELQALTQLVNSLLAD
jgi:PAS domain S-box-containing protein